MSVDTQSLTSPPTGNVQPGGVAADVLDSLDAALLVVDRNERIRYRNATATAWLPDGPDLQTVFAEARFLEAFDGWSALLRRVLDAGDTLRFQCALKLLNASPAMLATLHCTPLRERGPRRATGAVIRIEQEAKQDAVQERLEVSRRLTSLGKLATCVAHELNNPLDGILRYINLAMRVADDVPGSKLKSYLAESRTGLMRMLQIIGDLLEFSRATDGEFDGMNLNEVVEQAIRSSASAADAGGVIVAADFQTRDMPSVRGSRIYQVCCNLIKNALDALPNGGRLSITTGVVDSDVVIRVADTGIGLPEPVEKVFEPFFTTKEPGKGTGLGLAICKDFVEDMGGSITAAQGEPNGAVFTVRIPVKSCHASSLFMAAPSPS
jgi:signal transduction histidine kinase